MLRVVPGSADDISSLSDRRALGPTGPAAVRLVWLLRVGRRSNVHAPAQLPLILFVRD